GHALRNALIPVITVMGLYIGTLLAGTVLTETVFNRPGMGRLLIGAIQQRDYPLIQGGLMIYAAIIVIINTLVDILYGVVDPTIRYDCTTGTTDGGKQGGCSATDARGGAEPAEQRHRLACALAARLPPGQNGRRGRHLRLF